ncbi:tetratricopeptide repeat protein [Lacibacter luteus]|uniref:Oxygen sensor histidine kinase NreB n=1 Tax=Lacibacter luteus TaxID=2508719 RepID=A0A4Q1CPN0_9BACT|nr:sensor histidine kinase [Lacibacter luteus]RXK62755.1 tetratricopeptide repeat protein [Lacibacter luteus]
MFSPKNTLLLFFLLTAAVVYAQDTTVDSLRAGILRTSDDDVKLRSYILLTGKLSLVSFNETIKTGEEALVYAYKLNDSLAAAEINHYMGVANYFKGDYEKAASHYFFAERIYDRVNQKQRLGYVLNDLAKLYRKTRDLKRASFFYDRAHDIFRQLNDSSGMQMIMNESGVVFEYQGNYAEAIRRYNNALQIATRLKDEGGKAWSYNFLAGVYVLQSKFNIAEDYHLRALGIREKLKDTFALAMSYIDMGVMYSTWGKYERAVYYLDICSGFAERMHYKELLSNVYAEQSRIANVTGDYKKALDYYTWHTQLKDSLFNAQKNRQVEELSTLYETNKKEQQIEVQQLTIKKRNQQIFLILLFAALATVVTYLFYNRYRWKQQVKLQQEILKQQELATSLVLEAEEKERSRIAKDLHDGVGQMMSAARMNLSSFYNDLSLPDTEQNKSLKNIIQLVDESCKEVRAVSHSMTPAALLSKGLPQTLEEIASRISTNDFALHFYSEGFNDRPDSNTETILFRVIQECINNAIKHAQATTLDISLIKDHDGISVTIEDNGKGFTYNPAKATEGIGLNNIHSRIQFLKGSIDIDSAPGRGTLIAIHIPTEAAA